MANLFSDNNTWVSRTINVTFYYLTYCTIIHFLKIEKFEKKIYILFYNYYSDQILGIKATIYWQLCK